ncbi:cytochrome P450 [Favolaschia claudopus]|uniref:Cytochrome P450 n=1 Tax=Favolaschia claudopus TaxID=2862362 RepID=A0AAW0AFX8_9AGAR
MDGIQLALMVASILAFYLSYLVLLRRSSKLRDVRGPASPSWIFGNVLQLTLSKNYGEYEFQWLKKYGSAYRIKGFFGEDRLMVSDTAALQYMLNREHFVLGPSFGNAGRLTYSTGSVWLVEERDHKRVRTPLNAGFTAAAVRSYIPIFERVAQILTEQFDDITSDSVGDVSPLFGQATLAAVTEAVLGLSLDDLGDEYISTNLKLMYEFKGSAFKDLVLTIMCRTMTANQSATQLLVDALLGWIPVPFRDLASRIPVEPFKFIHRAKYMSNEIGMKVIQNSKNAKSRGLDGTCGLYGDLVGNTGPTFSERDIVDQTSLLLLAGQDTTANTLTFGFIELARNVDFQEQLRAEIHASLGSGDAKTYDTMPLLNAFIKEVLRMYPAVAVSDRLATEDVVLPLSEPIITSQGTQISEIPILKGQVVYMGTAQYQRSESRWGPDANEFNPSRWLKEGGALNGEGVSSYANLLTFFGGSRICLGWRFALLEMQIFICELVAKFHFSLPDEDHLNARCRYAFTLQPVLPDGKKAAFLQIKRVM